MEDTIAAIKALAASHALQPAPQLKNAIMQDGPAPVSIQGIPFQIGGGLGRDPALSNPDVLKGNPTPPDPYGSTPPQTAVRRRLPNG
jgi:hypothetical protein